MDRFTKIVLEQISKGQFGTADADANLEDTLPNVNSNAIESYFYFIERFKNEASRGQIMRSYLWKTSRIKNYLSKDYLIVLADKARIFQDNKQRRGAGAKRGERYWPVYIIKKAAIPEITDQEIQEIGGFSSNYNGAFVLRPADIVTLKNASAAKIQSKSDSEAQKQKDLERQEGQARRYQEYQKRIYQLMGRPIANRTIDFVNEPRPIDIRAYLELVYQMIPKIDPSLDPAGDITGGYARFKTQRNPKNKKPGPPSTWNTNLEMPTTANFLKKMQEFWKKLYEDNDVSLDRTNAVPQVGGQGGHEDLFDIAQQFYLEDLKESINYFKGTGMHVKLKDLIKEQNISRFRRGSGSNINTTNITSKNTASTGGNKGGGEPESKETSTTKCQDFEKKNPELVKKATQYKSQKGAGGVGLVSPNKDGYWYHGTTPINKYQDNLQQGISAIIHDMWGLYIIAVNNLVSDFCAIDKEDCGGGSWATRFKGYVNDDDADAAEYYFGNVIEDTNSRWYDRCYKYMRKAYELADEYEDVIRNCGRSYDIEMMELCEGSGHNSLAMAGVYYDTKALMKGNWDTNDNTYIELKHPRGSSYYSFTSDF